MRRAFVTARKALIGMTFLAAMPGLNAQDLSLYVRGLTPRETLHAVAETPSLIVAAGEGGAVYVARDGESWFPRNSGLEENLYGLVAGPSGLVAVGELGRVTTSVNGIAWEAGATPVAETLRGAAIGGDIAVAVGDNGTILTSRNLDLWEQQVSGTGNALYAVAAIPAHGNGTAIEGFIAVGAQSTLLFSADGESWEPRLAPPGLRVVLRTVLATPEVIVAAGDSGRIFFSDDAGDTWSSGDEAAFANFRASLVSDGFLYLAGLDGALQRSADGEDWEAVASGTTADLLAGNKGAFGGPGVANRLFAGAGGAFVRPDAANLWALVDSGAFEPVAATYGAGRYVVAGTGGTVLVSTNGNALEPVSVPDIGAINGVAFANERYILLGSGGLIAVSTDAGVWDLQATGRGTPLFDLAFHAGLYVAVGQGGVVLTSPDLTAWTSRTSNIAATLRGVVSGPQGLIAAGDDGAIIRSTNGISWTVQTSGTVASLQDVAASANAYVAVGTTGTLLRSTNGTAWSSRPSPVSSPLTAVVFDGSQFVAVGIAGAYVTSPSGQTWTAVDTGSQARFTALAAGGGALLGLASGGVIAEAQQGASTVALDGPLTANFRDVVFSGERFVAVGDAGLIATTVDGKVWARRVIATDRDLAALAAGASGEIVAVGAGGTVARSVDGGVVWGVQLVNDGEDLSDVAFGDGRFLIVDATGDILSRSGATWSVAGTVGVEAASIALGGGRIVVAGADEAIFSGTAPDNLQASSLVLPQAATGSPDAPQLRPFAGAPEIPDFTDVIATPDGFAAGSSTGDLWTSPDGAAFTLSDSTGGDTALDAICRHGSGLLGVGAGTLFQGINGALTAVDALPTAQVIGGIASDGVQVVVVGAAGLRFSTGGLANDTDGDALPDAWERLFAPDLATLDREADPDGDGFPAFAEFAFGQNPVAPDAGPPVSIGAEGTPPTALLVNVSLADDPDARSYLVPIIEPFPVEGTDQSATLPIQLSEQNTTHARFRISSAFQREALILRVKMQNLFE